MTIDTQSSPRSALRPGLAAAACLALVLGFAAAAAVLIAGKAVLVDELPFPDSSRLVLMEGTYTEKGEVQDWAISQMDFADWRKENRSFEQMSVYTSEYALNLAGKNAERLNAELVSTTTSRCSAPGPRSAASSCPRRTRCRSAMPWWC